MSNVDADNDVTENPHPEADAEAGYLDEVAEGQGDDNQDGSGDDSVEEGTEAELEAEDEAGTHQIDVELRKGSEEEEADADSEAEDHVMQAHHAEAEDGGGEERSRSLTEDDSACGGSMVEADIVVERSLTEADINLSADNDNTDTSRSPVSDGTDRSPLVAVSEGLNELTEADVGASAQAEGFSEKQVNNGTVTELSESDSNQVMSDVNSIESDGTPGVSLKSASDQALVVQSDTTEADKNVDSGGQTDVTVEQQSSTAKSDDKIIESVVSAFNENLQSVKIVCDEEKETEGASGGPSDILTVLEDEVGSVPCGGGANLLRGPGLQHAESEESYEPECDQDSDEVRASPQHTADSNDNICDSDVLCGSEEELDNVGDPQEGGMMENEDNSVQATDKHEEQQSEALGVSEAVSMVKTDNKNSDLSSQLSGNSSQVSGACSDVTSHEQSCTSRKTTEPAKDSVCLQNESNTLSNQRGSPAPVPPSIESQVPVQNCKPPCDKQMSSKCLQLDFEGDDDDNLLDELESELIHSKMIRKTDSKDSSFNLEGGGDSGRIVNDSLLGNGMVNVSERLEAKVREQIESLQKQLEATNHELRHQRQENQRIQRENEDQVQHTETVIKERDSYLQEIKSLQSKASADDLYLPQIKELEFTIAQQQGEIKVLKDKLTSHDAAAKRAICTLQNEMKLRVDQVTKMYEDANKEKDSMVMKYAQSERNFLEVQKMKDRLEARLREAAREKESFNNRTKDYKADKKRMMTEIETKSAENLNLIRELEKMKEALNSQDVRVKWAQNKLKAELEAHKETKLLVEKTNFKLKEAKEETEQIRKDCQAIVKTYQESEEIKSNSLDSELKKKQSELLLQKQEKTDQEEVHQATVQELDMLKMKHRETLSELQVLRDKSSCLETEQQQNEQSLNKFKDMVQKQKADMKELTSKLEELKSVELDFKRTQITIKSLDAEISELKISNKDLLIDMEACRKRETEKLELTEKLSAKNAELQSENNVLHNKVMTLSSEVETQRIGIQTLETNGQDLSVKLTREQNLRQQETTDLKTKLAEKTQATDDLTRRVEDEKDEIKTLKRKHANNIKDLTRQLQQTRRRLETFETNGERDTTSMGSRTSSNGSLNTAGNAEGSNHIAAPPSYNNHVHNRHPSPPQEQEYPVITEQVEPDRQLLIERIVKLQRSHARKNEKLEFMADHISQLVDQIQKKNKIIHSYALREESGTLTPEAMDLNKAQFSRKNSIMASLYGSHQTDGTMTLDLSLEINKKLQAVLEDALLKNITLKESIDTLGQEISRLSQENRQLQLQSQAKKSAR